MTFLLDNLKKIAYICTAKMRKSNYIKKTIHCGDIL